MAASPRLTGRGTAEPARGNIRPHRACNRSTRRPLAEGGADHSDRGRSVSKPKKHTAHLIAVHQKREAVRVYAVLAQSATAALAQVAEMATDDMQVELTGSLGRDLVRRLGLKPGEMRLV